MIEIDTGDLISKNIGFIGAEARKLSRRYCLSDMYDDLVQEGTIALMKVSEGFDETAGVGLMTYAAPAVRTAMLDYIAVNSLPLSLPPERVRLIRRAAVIGEVPEICEKLCVSEKVASRLLEEYKTIFQPLLVDENLDISCGGNPADAYEEQILKKHLLQLMEEVLSVRERNIVKLHLGLDDNEPMTFTELAIRLNYNHASGVEKVFAGAINMLKQHFNDGDYGRWKAAKSIIREAEAEIQGYNGYAPPQEVWYL